jgi:probable F420-dependent oxidoreductase
VSHPFRFIAAMPTLDPSPAAWREAVRRIEGAGYATVAISDHLTRGWAMDPLVAMMAAADATERLRVLSLVLSNDYRHPALVHKAIATIDVLSGGRVELGMGAGWLADDFDALGIPLEPVRVRIDRLAESVRLLKALFAADVPFDFDGGQYRGRGLEGRPRVTQQPRPPMLIGGGGKRVLSLAAREADIVGINASLAASAARASGIAGLTAAAAEEKVRWVREAATAAGRRPEDLELQVSVLELHVTDSGSERGRVLDSLAEMSGLDVPTLEESPAVLVGSLDACAAKLRERRSRFGFSYIKLGPDALAAAPLVGRLAGS